MPTKAKRYQVLANGEPRNPDFLGYPFAVIDTATNKVAMLANTRRKALAYAKDREAIARATVTFKPGTFRLVDEEEA